MLEARDPLCTLNYVEVMGKRLDDERSVKGKSDSLLKINLIARVRWNFKMYLGIARNCDGFPIDKPLTVK